MTPRPEGCNGTTPDPVLPEVITTEQIAGSLRCETVDHRPNHAVQLGQALELPEAELPIPAYALGTWLGDGHTAGARFTCADPEIVAAVEASGLVVTAQTGLNYCMSFPHARDDVADRICIVCGRNFTPKNDRVRTCGRGCGGKARFSPRLRHPPHAAGAEIREWAWYRVQVSATSAGWPMAACKQNSGPWVSSVTSTFQADTCVRPSRSGVSCSRDCSTPTGP